MPVSVDVHFGVDLFGEVLAYEADETVQQDHDIGRFASDLGRIAGANGGVELIENRAGALCEHGEVGNFAVCLSAPLGDACAGFASAHATPLSSSGSRCALQ